ncbi:MAG TPA: AI-2E family transporter [Candidatus Cloacimonadota bacterium]|nr:AI-2E family transporter [Candidatus Cloacimonadota bacterium]
MLKKVNYTKILFYLVLLTALGFGIWFYSYVFGYVIAALVLAYILDPLVNAVERLRFPRWLAVLSVYIVLAGLIALLVALFAPSLYDQGAQLISLLQEDRPGTTNPLVELPLLKDIHLVLMDLDARIPVLDLANEYVNFMDMVVEHLVELPKTIMQNYSTIIGAVSYVGMIPLICFFLLLDKVRFRKGILSLIPNRYFELTIILIGKTDETVGNFMRAMLFEVLAVALMVFVALSILNVPYAILIGVVAGVANIIPYFGPFIGGCVAVLSSLIAGQPTIMILWVALAMYLVQLVDNNLVYPVLVGKTIDMHPLIVLLTVLAGGWFGSLVWMLISVPLLYITYTMIRETYLNFKMFKLL